MGKFQPEFDRVGLVLSFASLLILLYFGLTVTDFVQNLWVAFAFWTVGFFGTFALGFARRSQALTLNGIFTIFVGTGLIIVAFFAISAVYGELPQDVWLANKAVNFAIGVSEELFFGVFVLSLLINWIGIDRIIAIIISAIVHSIYHVPSWGTDPLQISYFFVAFFAARSVYVFLFPKVGVLLGAHGGWNVGVS